jgi:periplasmic copper chaperone A
VKVPMYIVASTTALLLVLAPLASAHVTLQPEEIPAGGFTRLDVRVPNERDNASTTKVEVQFPPGFLFVSTEPVPGWKAEVTRRKLDKPVEQFGEEITEEVGQVSFTATDKATAIGPGQFRDFGLSLSVPEKPSTLTFKSLQTYSSGEVVRWIGPPDSEEPAPQVKLTAAEAEGGAAEPASEEQPAAAPAESASDDDGGSDTLAIIALVVAIAGLAAGVLALLRSRGRTREEAGVH